MKTISTGDSVIFLPDRTMNGGSAMSVVDIDGEKAKISFFDVKLTHHEQWVNVDDLEIIRLSDGGFRAAGE